VNLAVFALTQNGIRLAKNLSHKLGNITLFTGPDDLKRNIRYAFKRYDGLIFIMASGIVVRSIAPFLKNKAEDPAVVVVDEKGRYVISLLSGHLGGANNLGMRLKDMTALYSSWPAALWSGALRLF